MSRRTLQTAVKCVCPQWQPCFFLSLSLTLVWNYRIHTRTHTSCGSILGTEVKTKQRGITVGVFLCDYYSWAWRESQVMSLFFVHRQKNNQQKHTFYPCVVMMYLCVCVCVPPLHGLCQRWVSKCEGQRDFGVRRNVLRDEG